MQVQKQWIKVLAMILLIAPFILTSHRIANAADGGVLNPGFEESGNWGLEGWEVTGGDGIVSVKSGNSYSGTKALEYWSASAFSFTVSQYVYNIPNGIYSLSANVQGDGGEVVSRLFADSGEGEVTADYSNSGWSNWSQPQISAIYVRDGKLTIGIRVESTKSLWGVVDDILLTRIGQLPAEPASIASITPVTVTGLVNEKPELPSVVTAVYSDSTTKSLAVAWNAIAPEQYATPGSFEVSGVVTGTTIPAKAMVTITYRSADVNLDSVTNVGDLAIAAYYGGMTVSDEAWELARAADTNNDGIVDLTDQQLIGTAIRTASATSE
ncbi:Ig-like domain-containing protein [Paenibacillus chartarius]|uniref:Ig-like domain-containing protein n=1 Tax=Paenibacillus chartarius TaxID=747481 RepID=A0ABV6DPJ3_9BACL